MSDTICPKCRNRSKDPESCDSCGINFMKYQKDKQKTLDRVAQLLSVENFEEARTVAEDLGRDFPDSKGESVLLISNINRDISIEKKYTQAQELFDQGDFTQTLYLLRNIKAYAQVLDDKVTHLRQKAQRSAENDTVFNQAVDTFNAGNLAEAGELFQTVNDPDKQEQIDEYLLKIDTVKKELLHEGVECLKKNMFDAARRNFNKLHERFSDMRQETEGYMAIIAKKEEMKEKLLLVAEQAGDENRFVEAKVIYSFLGWQYPEFQPRLAPYMEKIPLSNKITLTDYEADSELEITPLGLRLDKYGFIESDADATVKLLEDPFARQLPAPLLPCVVNADSSQDPPSITVDLGANQVADFIY